MTQKVYGYAPENEKDDSVNGYAPEYNEKEMVVYGKCTDMLRNTDGSSHQKKQCTGMLRKMYPVYGYDPEYGRFDDDF